MTERTRMRSRWILVYAHAGGRGRASRERMPGSNATKAFVSYAHRDGGERAERMVQGSLGF